MNQGGAQTVIHTIRHIVEVPDSEAEKFLSLLKPSSLPKGSYFLREGQIPTKFAFISQGLVRYLYVDQKGTEYTKNFITAGVFMSSYSAMITQTPSQMYIQALEDSQLYEINFKDWLELKKGHPCWNKLLVYILEKVFALKEKRERDLLLLDAQTRYELFKKEYPNLEPRIKQHMIASYLGISPISLSRLKK